MPGKCRLLITGRDPGPAQNLIPVIKELQKQSFIDILILAQNPAANMFIQHGLFVKKLNSEPLDSKDSPRKDALFHEVQKHIHNFQPNAILTGLSGPGVGVDEAAQYLADGIPTYSIQDADGWVTEGFGKTSEIYFVSSEHAANITRTQGVEAIVVGIPKYEEQWEALQKKVNISAVRDYHVSKRERIKCVFYGQPLTHLPGYQQTLDNALKTVLQHPDCDFYFRPHPKEPKDWIHSKSIPIDTSSSIEESILHSDISLTCNSNCLQDLLYLQADLDFGIGVGIYLLWEPDICQYMLDNSGQHYPWFLEAGLSFWCQSKESLRDMLQDAISDKKSQMLKHRIKEKIRTKEKPSIKIVDFILKNSDTVK